MARLMWMLMIAGMMFLCGCPPTPVKVIVVQVPVARPEEGRPGGGVVAPPPGGVAVPPATGVGATVVTGVGPALKGRLSDQEKQDVVAAALLNVQRLIVSSSEQMKLSTRAAPSTAAQDAVTTKLAELSFKVIQSNAWMTLDPSEAAQDEYRAKNDCNIAVLIEGTASQADKLGDFYSFEAQVRGKVLNLTTHQIIATNSFLKRGKRALDEGQAAQSAMEAAAADLVTYLTDEVIRKWEVTTLVKMNLTVRGLDQAAKADAVRAGLQRRAGVYYASLESWDIRSQTATYEVLCRFDVQRLLTSYVDDQRVGGVKVTSVEQHGDKITGR